MRIAIDASRTTAARITGTETYAIRLIRGLLELGTRHDITLYYRDAPKRFPEGAVSRVLPMRRMWTHGRFAAALWQDRPDLTFVPAHTLPFFFPGRAAVTVHDLGFRYFPQAHPTVSRHYLDITTRFSAARAAVVLADSHATAHDLTRFYGTSPHKIQVVYPGVEAPTPGDPDAIRRKYGLPARYFLFIGTLQPRKNIARLVKAFAQYRQVGDPDTGLVLAGGKGWLYDPAWAENVPGVLLTGYVDDADKGALYAGAAALVFPTLYEGFGFPVLEAMLCGTPVIASNTSSLPELVGEAGLLVSPTDVDAISAAMLRLDDAALCQSLREKGLLQAGHFTWQAAARAALAAFETLERAC